MSVIRVLGRSLFRPLFRELPDLKASGRVPVKPGLISRGEFKDVNSTAVALYSRRTWQNVKNYAQVFSRHSWSGLTARAGFFANTQAAFLRRMSTSSLLRGCGPKAPVFAFLGFAYASSNVNPPQEVQESEQFGKLCQWIQGAIWTSVQATQPQANGENPSLSQLKLKDYEVGERLGENSSSAAVYAAKYQKNEYALKMLFNFGASSKSSSLHKEFAKECQVVSVEKQKEMSEAGPSYRRLPPHPNISPVLCTFADEIPCLPDGINSYPAALPAHYGEGCYGRNRTMFLVMPRYSRTVRTFIAANRTPDRKVATLLLLQLLEGITHMVRHGIAHRDLKTDNLLLDESTSESFPRLVIADFGCCLADRRWGLTIPFITEEIDRGGNSVLMAPEIACAVPGDGAVLDYTKSDAWAAGAISYELFGHENPFGKDGLDSRTYQDEQLPPLDQAPVGVSRVVSLLLKRNPSERITAHTSALMLALVLWAPAAWLQDRHVTVTDLDRWRFTLSVQTLNGNRSPTVEDEILRRFLCRFSEEDVLDALELLKNDLG